ncbi:Uncharacterised protein [Neisseria animaloris]|uniref:Uncharacterized protein n=1 Tax=Neisseria animaloris TaxID=326522 RepID=A0A3S4YQ40_9NEIS|nr:Uncharacterised protein [Neisseria animaloris]
MNYMVEKFLFEILFDILTQHFAAGQQTADYRTDFCIIPTLSQSVRFQCCKTNQPGNYTYLSFLPAAPPSAAVLLHAPCKWLDNATAAPEMPGYFPNTIYTGIAAK